MVLGITRPIVTTASRTATSVVARNHNIHALESAAPAPSHPHHQPMPLPVPAATPRPGYTYGSPVPRGPSASVPRSQSPPPLPATALSRSSPHVSANMIPDSKLLTTHKRHSDFDPHLIATDSRFAAQFYRWKEWHRKNASMVKTKMVRPGDIVAGSVKGARQSQLQMQETSFRPGIFKLQLLEEVQDATEGAVMTYRCKLLSVGDTVIPGVGEARSRLCVKLYDDRFFPSPSNVGVGGVESWYQPGDKHRSAEDYVRSELEMYQRTEGWKCHGAFRFVLSREGHWLHGILLEDVRPSALKA